MHQNMLQEPHTTQQQAANHRGMKKRSPGCTACCTSTGSRMSQQAQTWLPHPSEQSCKKLHTLSQDLAVRRMCRHVRPPCFRSSLLGKAGNSHEKNPQDN